MQRSVSWSYAPYAPYFFEAGDPYICRISPTAHTVTFAFVTSLSAPYAVYFRQRGEGEFEKIAEINEKEYTVTGLTDGTEYEFYVTASGKRSRVRLVKAADAVGTVVNYLHPEDDCYHFSGDALCSPSLLRCADGHLLASMDLFTADRPQNLTLVFRSDDDGETWQYQCELMPCFWAKLFEHKGKIYALACSTEYGDLLIGASEDGGKSFGAPTVLLRGAGRTNEAGVHKNPQNVVYYKGRIYETLEWGAWSLGYHAAMVMSCDENADLLDATNWSFSQPVPYDPNWEGTAKGNSPGTIEGTLVVFPDGKLYNVMRYQMMGCEPCFGRVLAYEVDTDCPTAPLRYSHAIAFPANHTKFMIKKDEATGYYYTIGSRITDPSHLRDRRLLSLMRSKDMVHFEVVTDIYDRRDADPSKVGFQYVDFFFEGEDILFLCRTALNGAINHHDANYSTFDRIKNFRSL